MCRFSTAASKRLRPSLRWSRCRDQNQHELPADQRRAVSGIEAGNVKEDGMRRIEQFGPFEIHGDSFIMQALDTLLRALLEQGRTEIAGDYRPC